MTLSSFSFVVEDFSPPPCSPGTPANTNHSLTPERPPPALNCGLYHHSLYLSLSDADVLVSIFWEVDDENFAGELGRYVLDNFPLLHSNVRGKTCNNPH